jgi:flavin reductase (DIM6/NTAB) family NADH-FMN oxidoreductase RutF
VNYNTGVITVYKEDGVTVAFTATAVFATGAKPIIQVY